ncbi:MAG: hypothetical protein KBC12_00280 [Candidatus Pacebacteria bacterium]|nr:hypothetical protein [Candidatus Paceibacterota bacterium]
MVQWAEAFFVSVRDSGVGYHVAHPVGHSTERGAFRWFDKLTTTKSLSPPHESQAVGFLIHAKVN